MNKILKLGVVLLIISAVSAGILGFANEMTKDKIAEIEQGTLIAALEEIFLDIDEMEELDGKEIKDMQEEYPDISDVYIVEGELSGIAIGINPKGFDGPVEMIVGIDENSEILGVRVVEHSETAGIGSKAAEPEYLDGFVGQGSDGEVSIDTVSGATITSNAVIKGVNDAIEIFNEVLD